MFTLNLNDICLSVDFEGGQITSLCMKGMERIAAPTDLFGLRLRDREGKAVLCSVHDARCCTATEDGAIYTKFPEAVESVRVRLTDENGEAAWRIEVTPVSDDYFVEWVDLAPVTLPALEANNPDGTGGKVLFPYDEGVLVRDANIREETWSRHCDAEYPSSSGFSVFPNKLCSQMLAYLWEDAGLYVGAHDERRAVKEIDYLASPEGITLRFRLFAGVDFGETFTTDYPIVFARVEGRWEAAAERYRAWFESALPPRARKITENSDLPAWYADSPLVITYPVRGVHDYDEMKPNKLYPYTNALPILDRIRKATDSRLLVLLMHWEGSAPWAPPYVWPPYGGTENFTAFQKALKEQGDLFGVYCSGFSYTKQSTLIAECNNEEEYNEKELWRGMCAGPDGTIAISKICTYQRSGYDICPVSPVGREILDRAYAPLFENGLDYVQILDQNHGGGQHLCYSRSHGHAPGPGGWMTENMQAMLAEWNKKAGKLLFGCESAAAEPFIGNLLFSDNRYELNYRLGTPVPLYAYIYHEYVRNFMGNQVGCPFPTDKDSLRYRLAYSFAIGDCMTLVLTEEGELMTHWGLLDLSRLPDKEKTLRFIATLSRFYREEAKAYLYAGRMITPPAIECATVEYGRTDSERVVTLPAVLSSAWEAEDGSRAVILVNPDEAETTCHVDGKAVTVPAMSAILLPL